MRGNRLGFGKTPALVVIDFVQAYTLEDSPLFAQGVVAAVAETRSLLQVARRHGLLVVHTTIAHHANGLDAGAWLLKSPVVQCISDPRFSKVCEGAEPVAGELVVAKQYASAFFGTSLTSTLVSAGVDTVVIAGCSTSGCVRATAVDAIQSGFQVIVPRECVGDRHVAPHEANLHDIDSLYGDVLSKQEVLNHLSRRET